MTPYERNMAMRRIVTARATERNYGHPDGGRRCAYTDAVGRCCYGDGHSIASHLTVPAAAPAAVSVGVPPPGVEAAGRAESPASEPSRGRRLPSKTEEAGPLTPGTPRR